MFPTTGYPLGPGGRGARVLLLATEKKKIAATISAAIPTTEGVLEEESKKIASKFLNMTLEELRIGDFNLET